jgi:UDP-2,3-diacylglucosamine pyrophosphatase LpxH
VTHGDEFDHIVTCNKLKSFLGNHAYDVLIWVNRVVNGVRRKLGLPYWSLATYLKHKSRNALEYIHRFESAVLHEAHRKDVDGFVCGHLHRAEIEHIDGVLYCNDGDWVENCTAVVERNDGVMQLIHWADEKHAIKNIAA